MQINTILRNLNNYYDTRRLTNISIVNQNMQNMCSKVYVILKQYFSRSRKIFHRHQV